MDSQDQCLTQATGHENHGVHLCHKCRWPFPNPHPSAKHRRAHKRICGTIEGYKLVEADVDAIHPHLSYDEHHSDEDRRKTPSPRRMEPSNTQKPSGGVGERLISGDEVFADAVAEFSDGGWNSRAEDNVLDNLKSVTVNDDTAHIRYIENFGGSAVVLVNQLNRMSNDSNQMQEPEATSISESKPMAHDHTSSQAVNSMANVSDYRTEEAGVMLPDSTPGLSSDTYPNKIEGPINVLQEADAGNGVTKSTFSLLKYDADNIPVREAPIRTFEETSNLNANDVASSDAEPVTDFAPKEENGAEGLLELQQNAHTLDVGPLQHASISANNSQVDLGLHTLHEQEEKEEGACKISVPDYMFNLANPTILIEDSEDPEGVKVKLQISSTLQSHETIRNDEGDLTDVASVERFTVLQSESSSIASEVPPGESYVADRNATQQNKSYKLVVIEKPREQQIVEPPVEGKINVDQHSDVIEASLIDFGPDMSGQTCSLSKEQYSDYVCEDALVVHPPDCPMSAPDAIPADVVRSVDLGKNTSVDGNHKAATEESDRAIGISTLQSNSKEPLLQDKLPANIVDVEGNSNYVKLETESHDTVEFHFTEGSMESEGHLHETNQTASLICNDNTHHFEDMKNNGVFVDESDKLEADTKRFHDDTNTATPQPCESLSQSQEEPLINKGEGYSLGLCKTAENEIPSIAEDQSLAGHLGKNTSPLESAISNEIVDGSATKSQGIPCLQSPTVSGSEKETNEDDTYIIDIVPVQSEGHADTAVDLQTDIVTQDKEMENPINKDNQTEESRGEAAGLLSASTQDQGGNELVKQHTGVSGIDFSVGICSRSDSLECNWGSVSVLSLQSDAPTLLDAESLPPVDCHALIEGNSNFKSDAAYDFQQTEKSEMHEPPSFMTLAEPGDGGKNYAAVSERQTGQNPQHPSSNPLQCGWFPFPSLPQVANDSEGRKKNEEIIAKVTNWSTGKQHAPLKSLLSEAAQDTNSKSPTMKENLGLENQKSEKMSKDNCTKTTTTVHSILGPESPAAHVAKKEIAQEWNSPARYPSDIQREKRKVKGRPFWTQFVCCTSVNSSNRY